MTPAATAADAAGYARCPGERSENFTRAESHDLPARRIGSANPGQQAAHGLREIDAPHRGARLERVVRERLHHAGARDRHDPHRGPVRPHVGDEHGVAAPPRLQQRREAHADERGEIGAGDLRRLLDGAILRRQPRQLRSVVDAVDLGGDAVIGLDGERVGVGFLGAAEVVPCSRESRRFGPARLASAASSATALRKCSSAWSTSPFCRSTPPARDTGTGCRASRRSRSRTPLPPRRAGPLPTPAARAPDPGPARGI